MLIQDAYLAMYNILNSYYLSVERNESLGSLLSDMDPNLFADGMAADPATYNDWNYIVNDYTHNGIIDNNKIILALVAFLSFYQERFGYNLEDVIKYIITQYRDEN